MHVAAVVLQRVGRIDERDEVGGDEAGALVDELVERVLPVGAGLAPEDLAGVGGDRAPVPAHRLAVGLHGELLQIGGESVQLLGVGEDRVRLGTEEVRVPDVRQTHENGHVEASGRVAHMLVHRVEAGEQIAEHGGSECDGQRQAYRRIHRVAAADPVPEPERVRPGRCRTPRPCRGPSRRRRSGVRRRRSSPVGSVEGAGAVEPRPEPVAGQARVGEGLEGGERLRGDDEQRRLRVEVGGRLGAVGGVDVRDEPGLDAGVGVGRKTS